jgi:Leucine-rich repeat (LRR) protein
LTQLPPEIGHLTSLVELNLDENKLTQLPREIGQLCSLQILNFNQNELNDLPDEIYLLPLKMFGIDDNPLEAIPPEVVEAGSQEVFDFLGSRLQERSGGQIQNINQGQHLNSNTAKSNALATTPQQPPPNSQ